MERIPPESAPIKILVVDDRPENIAALKAILEYGQPGYELLTARSGPEALGLVLRHEFALILLDVFMGEMDGFEVATLIKIRQRSRHIPIIFLTAMAKDLDHIFKAYSIGAVDYIQKPLEPSIVRAKVAVFAELHRNKLWIRHQEEVIRDKELREKELEVREARRNGERKFQDLVEGIDHGFVWSAEPDTLAFSYVSPRAEVILGYTLDEWRYEPGFFVNHLLPEDRETMLGVFEKAQMGRDLAVDHRFVTSDGAEVWLHTGVRLARRGEGAGYELRGLSVDITRLKNVEAALRESVRARDEFLSVASHELKTPITPLKLQIQHLGNMIDKGKTVDAERLGRAIDVCNRQLDRFARLVEDLLDVSRISEGKLKLNPERVDLPKLLFEVTERYRGELTRAGCEVTFNAPESLQGWWDPLRIEQVYVNLLVNAIRYAPGKPVNITLCTQEGGVRISVKDEGIGIPLEHQARIFERFERAVEATHFGGLGLGLYICRKLVEAQGGSIRVASEPGKGSEFTVELPRVIDPEALPNHTAKSADQPLAVGMTAAGTRPAVA